MGLRHAIATSNLVERQRSISQASSYDAWSLDRRINPVLCDDALGSGGERLDLDAE